MEETNGIENMIQLGRSQAAPPDSELESRLEKLIREKGVGGGTGGDVTIDSSLSETSTNPVQNRIVTAALKALEDNIGDLTNIPDNGIDNPDDIFDFSRAASTDFKYAIGLYRQGSTNIPDNESDWIIISFRGPAPDNNAEQIAISSGAEICKVYLRNHTSEGWSDWDKFAMASDIPEEVEIDSELSKESENPVQNKAIAEELEKKAPLKSPILTGTPETPTADLESEDGSKQIANVEYVKALIKALVNNAPEDMNTLKELADAITEMQKSEDPSDYNKAWTIDSDGLTAWRYPKYSEVLENYGKYKNTEIPSSSISFWVVNANEVDLDLSAQKASGNSDLQSNWTKGLLISSKGGYDNTRFELWCSLGNTSEIWF